MSELKAVHAFDVYESYTKTGDDDAAQVYLKSEADKVIAEQKAKAVSQHGERSTPFMRTIEALRKSAMEHPDYTLKQLLEITPTHYCHKESAASAIRSWASKGIIEKFWK